MTVDPSDDCTFWYTQEYYITSTEPGNTTAPWHTRIAKFAPGPCATSPRGTISGTITNCQTGLPIPNAFVSISGGFSRATGAAGTYSAIVTPGTYNVSATGTGYDTASTTGLVVANGGAVTFNACLNGNLKQPVADTASITADSCNSNGAIDPNEDITVSLGVKNTGTLNTVNLVGTLQATGGVTSPSGPQNYGVVVAGGATVFRSFTFTAGNLACGAPLVISLQLQDGPTDLGTVTYNFTTGVIVVNNYSTGNIAVPIPDNPAPAINIPITVADVMTLSDVNVSFRLNHTFDGDLRISLVHPDGTVIPLVTNRGSSGANFGTGTLDCAGVPTVIDDQAATAISAGGAPFAGSFRPESPLSGLDGKPSNGTWNLRIQDTANLDTGTVGCVKLELNKRFVCCGSLIEASSPTSVSLENCGGAGNGAIDPGETVTVALPVVNNGGTPTTNLVATLQLTGGVSAIYATNPQNYGVVTLGGGAVSRSFRFQASGSCGGTLTATLQLQDGATNLGTVSYNFQLGTTTLATQSFSNTTAILIPAGQPTTTSGVATPYPSNITVSGVTATVTKVTVELKQFNHTFPDDVDVLLVSPTGQKMIIMADTGGSPDAVNADITLDDAAAALLPDGTVITTGTFRPTNIGTGDTFAAPAPAAPYLSAATAGTDTLNSAFAGQNPNGTWSLYVVDDLGGDVGNFNGGWALNITTATPVCCSPTAAPAFISGTVTTPDGAPLAGVTMNLSGARSAKVITDSNGNYRFRNIDTDNFYIVTPSLINYHFGPESRSFSLLANMTDAVFTATRDAAISGNAIDTPDYFVRQHYVDFLGREPDESGFNFWSDQILSCGADATCIERRTINVSAAYFLSIEFQETGGLVDGLYRASYNRRPLFNEFMPDTRTVAQGVIVGTTDWAGQLEANKQAFVAAWVQRSEFQAAYGGLTNEGYVDTLISHTGVSFTQSERNKLVSGLNTGASTRADVLRQIAENDRFVSAKRNETFVMMEYFGYLRRDPDESGYQFWLNKLNQFDGNFERAEMVKAFLVSGEYRERFAR
jgi:subtilisin-like proprotein convertase family protein